MYKLSFFLCNIDFIFVRRFYMLILKFQGGLGNQLFQYALYRKLTILGKHVSADLHAYTDGRYDRPFLLNQLN